MLRDVWGIFRWPIVFSLVALALVAGLMGGGSLGNATLVSIISFDNAVVNAEVLKKFAKDSIWPTVFSTFGVLIAVFGPARTPVLRARAVPEHRPRPSGALSARPSAQEA